MPLEIRAWKFAVPLIGTLFLAAACSSNNNPTTSGCDAACERSSLQTFFETPSAGDTADAAEEDIVRQTLAAASATPVGAGDTGGVSQASGTVLTSAPEILIAVDDDRTTFDITIGDFTIDTTINAAGTNTDTTTSGNVDNTGLMQSPAAAQGPGNDQVVTFVQPQVDGSGDSTGSLHVWLSTDKPGSVGGEDDYLAYGFWINSMTGSATTTNDGVDQIGAFVDSNSGVAFPGTRVEALTGDAVYIGEASGLYHEDVGDVSDFLSFTAETRLIASFGANDAVGTVEGTIHNFQGLRNALGTPTVTLSQTALSESEGGLFNGATVASITLPEGTAATPFAGTWGGKLYDTRNLAVGEENYPGTVAGTFGLHSTVSEDRRALLGVFWGDYDPDPPAAP